WLIAQHAVGEPDFQRSALVLVATYIEQERVPAWHAAYLEDRIALHEGRPQRFGTQWIQDATDGRFRPWSLVDAERVSDHRAEVGLRPLQPIPEPGPALPTEEREEIERSNRWWQEWLISKGWRV